MWYLTMWRHHVAVPQWAAHVASLCGVFYGKTLAKKRHIAMWVGLFLAGGAGSVLRVTRGSFDVARALRILSESGRVFRKVGNSGIW